MSEAMAHCMFCILSSIVAFVCGVAVAGNLVRLEAVQKGHADYCPKTGEWRWIGEECGE